MEVLESTFIKGLRPKIKAELRLRRPNGLGQIWQLAQLIEDRNNIVKGGRDPLGPRVNRFFQPKVRSSVKAFQHEQ